MTSTPDLVAEVRVYAAQLSRAADGASYVQDGYVRVKDPAFLVALMDGVADRLESLSTVERQGDDAAAAVDAFAEICDELGCERDNEAGLQAAHALKAEVARLTEALKQARRTMRNCAGAIQSGQIVDKEVDRNLRCGYEAIDAMLNGRAALTEQKP